MTQPTPTPNDGKPVWLMVIADMHDRDELGRKRYGTPLQAHNGRDALRDAYEEALDLAVYLRQEIEERDAQATRIAKVEASLRECLGFVQSDYEASHGGDHSGGAIARAHAALAGKAGGT